MNTMVARIYLFPERVSFVQAFLIFSSHLAGSPIRSHATRSVAPKMFSYTILMICSCCRLSPDGLSRDQLFKLLWFLLRSSISNVLATFRPFFFLTLLDPLSFSFVIFRANRTLSLVVLVIPPSLDLRTPSIFLTEPRSPFLSRFYNSTSLPV